MIKQFDFKSLRPILVMLAVSIFSVTVILVLYFYNNRYMGEAGQPSCGILDLSGEGEAASGLRWLVKGWEYYEGELLGPEDFADGKSREPEFVNLGKYGVMSREGAIGWIRGTFRLRLVLPETEQVFALEMPEISASSRMYIQNRLAMEWGDPQESRPGIRSAIVPIRETGEIQILIQVADLASIHAWMFAPPTLGSYEAVARLREVNLYVKAVTMVLACVASLLSLQLAIQIRWWRGFLFFLFCQCFVGYAVWPLIRSGYPLEILPWHAISRFSFFSMLWLAVILENDLYRIRGGVVSAVMGGFCILSLTLSFFVEYIPSVVAGWFHYLTEWYKFAVAFYLILVAERALVEEMERAKTLLVMAVAFTSVIFMEQLLPYYEPVIGEPFMVLGCIILIVGLLSILWQDMVDAYRSRAVFVVETGRMNRQLSMQQEHYRQLNARIEETRRLRHDMRHHIRILNTLYQEGNTEQVGEYLRKLTPSMAFKEPVTHTDNYALDAVLCHYEAAAARVGIETEISAGVPERAVLPGDELCVIVGNLMENALEACERQEEGKRFIHLKCIQDSQRLAILLDNSYNGQISYKGGYFRSSKRTGMGIGVESVKAIVKKYGGLAEFEPGDRIFKVSVVIPVTSGESGAKGEGKMTFGGKK